MFRRATDKWEAQNPTPAEAIKASQDIYSSPGWTKTGFRVTGKSDFFEPSIVPNYPAFREILAPNAELSSFKSPVLIWANLGTPIRVRYGAVF